MSYLNATLGSSALAFVILPFPWFGLALEQETVAVLRSGRSLALAGFVLLALGRPRPVSTE